MGRRHYLFAPPYVDHAKGGIRSPFFRLCHTDNPYASKKGIVVITVSLSSHRHVTGYVLSVIRHTHLVTHPRLPSNLSFLCRQTLLSRSQSLISQFAEFNRTPLPPSFPAPRDQVTSPLSRSSNCASSPIPQATTSRHSQPYFRNHRTTRNQEKTAPAAPGSQTRLTLIQTRRVRLDKSAL